MYAPPSSVQKPKRKKKTFYGQEQNNSFLSASNSDIIVAWPPEQGKKYCRFFPVKDKILRGIKNIHSEKKQQEEKIF